MADKQKRNAFKKCKYLAFLEIELLSSSDHIFIMIKGGEIS